MNGGVGIAVVYAPCSLCLRYGELLPGMLPGILAPRMRVFHYCAARQLGGVNRSGSNVVTLLQGCLAAQHPGHYPVLSGSYRHYPVIT